MAGYLLFATERYALPILAPLVPALHAAGHEVAAWFEGGAASSVLPGVPSIGLKDALTMRPRAVLSAAFGHPVAAERFGNRTIFVAD